MSDCIRVMIYDKTALDDGFDYTEQNDDLTMSWVWGAKLYKLLRSVDIYKGVSSWEEAVDWLNTVDPDKKISQISFWGHGSPGRSYIGQEILGRAVTKPTHDLHAKFVKLSKRLTPKSVIWFRNCSVFCGDRGQLFAERFSTFMNCRVAAHTYIIGVWQAGLHTIEPGQKAYWPADEGIKSGTAADPEEIKWSRPWTDNSIICLRGDIPQGW